MIKIIAFGSAKNQITETLIEDYIRRINKYHRLEIVELKESVNKSVKENLKLESIEIQKHIPRQSYIIVTDINGQKIDSIKLSNQINNIISHYPSITFIIGSSNGMANEIKTQAHMILSFSDLTFPHMLFRVMLLEQIYRSFKIINNERYHK